MAKKAEAEAPQEEERKLGYSPEDVRKLRMDYDQKCRDGVLPKSMTETIIEPNGAEIVMAWAYYVLEFWETCVIWKPQSRTYQVQPDLVDGADNKESDKS